MKHMGRKGLRLRPEPFVLARKNVLFLRGNMPIVQSACKFAAKMLYFSHEGTERAARERERDHKWPKY